MQSVTYSLALNECLGMDSDSPERLVALSHKTPLICNHFRSILKHLAQGIRWAHEENVLIFQHKESRSCSSFKPASPLNLDSKILTKMLASTPRMMLPNRHHCWSVWLPLCWNLKLSNKNCLRQITNRFSWNLALLYTSRRKKNFPIVTSAHQHYTYQMLAGSGPWVNSG